MNSTQHTSRGAGMNRTIKVTIFDPIAGTTKTGSVYKLTPAKGGILGKEVGTNYNVFRPWDNRWGANVYVTNITSSTRFELETEGMTPEEVTAFMNEAKYNG